MGNKMFGFLNWMETRMGIVRVSAAGMAVFLLLSSGVAASGFEALGVGAKATAMGGAFRAVADDWSAAYYNPAGYADLLDNQLGANLALFQYRNEITPDYRWGGQYETGMRNDRPGYNFDEILNNPSAGLALRFPVFGETVFGLSIYQPFDYNVKWNLYQPLTTYNSKLTLPGNQFQNNFDVGAFQLTAAREYIEDKLSLGVGLQLLRADLLYTNVIFRTNPYLARDPEWGPADRPWEKVTEWTSNDGKGWGFGLNLGAKLKQSEKMTLAATITVPFDITVEGESSLEFYLPQYFDTGFYTGGTVEHMLSSGSKIVDSAHYEATLKLPPSLGLGMAYQATEKLLVTVDAEYTLWSRFDGFNFVYSNHRGLIGPADTAADMREFFTSDIAQSVDWSNTIELMAGAAYDYSDFVTLLGGLSMDQSPARKNEQFHPLFFDLGTKLSFSTGLILHLEQWDLGVSTSYTRYPDASVEELEDIDGDGHPENFAGDFKAASYQTVFSFNYRF